MLLQPHDWKRVPGELLILLPTYARWRFHERRDWTCHQRARGRRRIEQPRGSGRTHGPVARGGRRSSKQTCEREKSPRDPRCESRTFPRRGPHVSDRRLRSLRSGAPGGPRGSAVRSPPRLSVWLGGAHVRPPTAASSVPSGRKGAGTGGAPDGDPRDECRAGPSLTPRSRTAAGHYFCRRSCFSNFFLSFPACSFFFGSAGGRTTWATSGPCHVIAATRALPCHIGGTG